MKKTLTILVSSLEHEETAKGKIPFIAPKPEQTICLPDGVDRWNFKPSMLAGLEREYSTIYIATGDEMLNIILANSFMKAVGDCSCSVEQIRIEGRDSFLLFNSEVFSLYQGEETMSFESFIEEALKVNARLYDLAGIPENASPGSALYVTYNDNDTLCLWGDGECQGVITREGMFPGNDGNVFRTCATRAEALQTITNLLLSEDNIFIARQNMVGDTLQRNIAECINNV